MSSASASASAPEGSEASATTAAHGSVLLARGVTATWFYTVSALLVFELGVVLATERVRDRLGGHHSARILLDSLDFAEIEAMQASDDWAEAICRTPTSSRTRVRTVGLLGTAFTMEKPFYADRLAAHGIRTIAPDAEGRRVVHDVTYDELVHGIVRDESRERYRQIIAALVARGAEGIILGCTEIELLIGADDATVPVYPTTSLHADAALDAALGG